MLRRVEEPAAIVTNYSGFYSELAATITNSTAVLLDVQAKSRAKLMAFASAAAAASPAAMSKNSSFDELAPAAPPMAAMQRACCPQSPISIPSLKRPTVYFAGQ